MYLKVTFEYFVAPNSYILNIGIFLQSTCYVRYISVMLLRQPIFYFVKTAVIRGYLYNSSFYTYAAFLF